MREAKRLKHVSEYYFSKKLKEIKGLTAAGSPIINMGIGSPDLEAPSSAIGGLIEALSEKGVHQYQSYIGRDELRDAFARFYKTHYEVTLDPTNEILPLSGSKEGIFHISMAFLNAKDVVLIPNPGYPTYESVARLVGARAVFYPLDEKGLPDFSAIDEKLLERAVLMWVNYPHMPTGITIGPDGFKHIINLAKKHDLLVVNDNPYSFIGNDNPTSILAHAQGYKNILELNSLSKVFNMAGWRVGAVVGPKALLQSVLKVKSNIDSGMFFGVQRAAVKALAEPKSWFVQLNEVYMQRRKLVEVLVRALNLEIEPGQTGMFVWCKLPKGVKSEAFTDKLLSEYALFCAPGFIFGSEGKHHVRFSLCVTADQIEKAITRVKTKKL
ncbi:MAG: aminotransferase class I/II-fold pyridoxal phosphate-dependent enzyme [Bacteroidetes bacterium]|nr:aminotransferase class I/II-fold pyridoxal phosphate-dependent enzyme [Bacteroidota bacterium]